MSKGLNRADRLREMERLYRQRGFTDIEMGERLGVDRTTAYKDRLLLETEVPFLKDENGRWRIDRTKYLSNIRLNLHETLVLYLAARRASRQTRLAQPHVAEALSKLASIMHNPMTERLVSAADAILTQHRQPERVAVLETVVQAWVEQVKLRLVYRALNARHSTTHLVHPYLIEPSLWSDSTYLIGLSEQLNKLIPFKIERIERASLTTTPFDLPEQFDEETLLRHAWGIWYSERDPVLVVLCFRGETAVQRLQESIWHPNEHKEILPDGDCLWQADVDEWQEMLPWIRGWGADCEVLEPVELRETIMGEAKLMAEVYGWHVSSEDDRQSSVLDDFFG